MLVIPFKSYVDGREAAISANWKDLANYEDIQRKQVDNLFAAQSLEPKLQNLEYANEAQALANAFSLQNNPYTLQMNRNRAGQSNLDMAALNAAQPGRMAAAQAQSQAQQQYAAPFYDGQAKHNLQQQQAEKSALGMRQAAMDEFERMLLADPGFFDRYRAWVAQNFAPVAPAAPSGSQVTGPGGEI